MKRPSFLALPRPVVACIMGEPTVAETIATIRNGEFDGAPAFAIHLEKMNPGEVTRESLAQIMASTRRPVMALRYRGQDGLTDGERAQVLAMAAECGAAAVDITADMFDASPLEFSTDPAAIGQQTRFVERMHAMGVEVVLSSHIYEPRDCGQVLEQMLAMEGRGADYVKIVTMAETEDEFLEAVRTTLALRKALKTPFIHLCGGRFARPQRFLSPALGCALTFCVQRYTSSFTTAQPPVGSMLSVLENYQWHISDWEE